MMHQASTGLEAGGHVSKFELGGLEGTHRLTKLWPATAATTTTTVAALVDTSTDSH
jgi:hypothetical protein